MKNDYDLTKQYQDDLIKAYNQVANLCWTQEEAYRRAVKQPAPRYYVSPRQALQIISPMVKGNFERVDGMLPNRKRMYYSLYDKVKEMSEKRAFIGKSLYYIIQFAVCSPAPEFFISYKAIRRIRCMMKNGHINEDGSTNIAIRQRGEVKRRERIAKLEAYRAQFRTKTP